MDLKDIRVANAKYLADKYGRKTLAEKLGYEDENYLNQIVNGHGSFGNKIAKRFEQKLQLPPQWMDHAHPAEWGASEDPEVYRAMISGLTNAQVRHLINACLEKISGQ